MSKAIQNRLYISPHIRLDFLNHSNLKQDIQNRQSDDIEMIFFRALQNIQGDNKETKGESLSEIVKLGMAYFFECIYPKNTPIKDSHYSVNAIKGFFDACSLSPYTAIYEVDTTYYKLRETVLFKACYLIIQCAWFINSEHFGSHQYLDYTSHYIQTGNKLPIDNYNYDKEDLLRKYARIDEKRYSKYNPKGEPSFLFVERWYFYILYMVCKELELPTEHFKVVEKDYREYNPLTKCPKILRVETPFKMIECDIKSAFPSFLDLQTGSRIKDKIYSNLMERKGISRPEAKIEFNKILNSGKYKTKSQIKSLLKDCGYSDIEAEEITNYTNGKVKFICHMSELEKCAIEDFKEINALKTAVRLHDSVLFIDTGQKQINLEAENGIINFGLKVLKHPVYTNHFGYSDKRLPYAYISSVPPATDEEYKNLIRKQILTNPKIKGEANGFRFYEENYEYISANFNINQILDFEEFIYNCVEMICTLHFLNKRPISKNELYLILIHIRQNSNIIFNLRYLFRELLRFRNRQDNFVIQERDYDLKEKLIFRKRIDFLIALNTARGKVNLEAHLKTILFQLQESISRDKYEWIQFDIPKKRENLVLVHAIARHVNCLRTGKKKYFDAQTQKFNPLYNPYYKETGKIKSKHYKKANKIRLIQRKIEKYQKDLTQFIKLQTDRKNSLQYIHIIGDLLGIIPDTDIKRDDYIILSEKKVLLEEIGAKDFNSLCKPVKSNPALTRTPIINDFDTSLEHSAFNISIEEAYQRGDQFFYEYLKFHKMDGKEKKIKIAKKSIFKLPEIEFNE